MHLRAGILEALEKGKMGGEEERRLHFLSAYCVPITEPGLSQSRVSVPLPTPCKLASVTRTLRTGGQCSQEPRIVECSPSLLVFRAPALALQSGSMMGVGPSARIRWWAFAHPW